ncbi:MAG: EAL domain-containing protein [Wenzhouxiangella sp.]
MHPVRILIISDDPARQAEVDQLAADAAPVRLILADTANAVSRLFGTEAIDLVLVYASSEEPDLLESATTAVREADQATPLLAVIEAEDTQAAMAAAACGVEGFVSESNVRQLRRLLVRGIEQVRNGHEARQAAQRLSEIENRYTLLLESSSEAIAYLHEGLHIFANPAYLQMFGVASFDEVEGLSMLDLLEPGSEGPDLKQILKSLQHDQLPSEPLSLHGRRLDGSEFDAIVTFSRARYAGESCAQMLIREDHPDADPAMAEELNRLKQSDLLTGYLNQGAFNKRVDSQLALTADPTHLSVMLMSVDQADKLQARVGIGATDSLIRSAGQLMIEGAGAPLAVARVRDQIFAVLVQTSDPQGAETLARDIVEHCNGRMLEIGDLALPVTVSVGIAQGSSGEINADTLISQAGLALTEALRSGGNAYVRYRPRISDDVSDDDMAWHERLIHALDHDEIRLMTSPITRMDDDATTIYEIESRMRAEGSDEVLLPSVFLNAAARVGLAPRMDKDLLRRLAASISERDAGADEAWLVTLSAQSIIEREFCDHLDGLLAKGQLNPNQLIWAFRDFEIEDKLRQAQAFIDRFQPMGCRFALTDVGPESAVEATLKFLDLAYVRLAPEMVLNLGENEPLRRKLADLVSEANQNDTRIIAPRVENTSDLATLWQLGITLVQGDFVREQASF